MSASPSAEAADDHRQPGRSLEYIPYGHLIGTLLVAIEDAIDIGC